MKIRLGVVYPAFLLMGLLAIAAPAEAVVAYVGHHTYLDTQESPLPPTRALVSVSVPPVGVTVVTKLNRVVTATCFDGTPRGFSSLGVSVPGFQGDDSTTVAYVGACSLSVTIPLSAFTGSGVGFGEACIGPDGNCQSWVFVVFADVL